MQWLSVRPWLPLMMVLAFGSVPVCAAQSAVEYYDGVAFVPVRPSETDLAIKSFDEPHWVYVKPGILQGNDPQAPADRHELLLWLPGTRPRSAPLPSASHMTRGVSHTLCLFAATLGYHVIALSYPNAVSTTSCTKDPDPAALATFHRNIIAGGASTHVAVSTTDSIQNRLIRLLQTLSLRFPGEGWDSFLNADGSIPWEKIAVAGQSQGGGHAAFIGVRRRVARVLCFGAPKDYNVTLGASAAWLAEPSATPKELFFAFNHQQDRQGCTPEHQLDNLRALGLEKFGPAVSVDSAAAPYQNSHILMTNYPGTKVNSETAHGEMINPNNSLRFGDVWRYMLTQTVALPAPVPPAVSGGSSANSAESAPKSGPATSKDVKGG